MTTPPTRTPDVNSSLKELLERVEKAEGADREIDGAVYVALECIPNDGRKGANGMTFNRQFAPHLRNEGGKLWPTTIHDAPYYTASLDAALALCERVLPGWEWQVIYAPKHCDGAGCSYAGVCDEIGDPMHSVALAGKRPALALLSAMLRALISEGGISRSAPSLSDLAAPPQTPIGNAEGGGS
jgi:hypothetical protein